jgi:hypothetical protein
VVSSDYSTLDLGVSHSPLALLIKIIIVIIPPWGGSVFALASHPYWQCDASLKVRGGGMEREGRKEEISRESSLTSSPSVEIGSEVDGTDKDRKEPKTNYFEEWAHVGRQNTTSN